MEENPNSTMYKCSECGAVVSSEGDDAVEHLRGHGVEDPTEPPIVGPHYIAIPPEP